MKWFGSQVCACFRECNNWRSWLLKGSGDPGQVLKRPWGLEVNRETCFYVRLCMYVKCSCVCLSEGFGPEAGGGAAASAAHTPRYQQHEIPRIQGPETERCGCLSQAAGGICIVHMYVFPANEPSSRSAREGHWMRLLCCLCFPEFCVFLSVLICAASCVYMCVCCVCVCMCAHWEYMLSLIIGWTWAMELWQSHLF